MRTRTKRIYLSSPRRSGRELEFIQVAFETNWTTPLGPHVIDHKQKSGKATWPSPAGTFRRETSFTAGASVGTDASKRKEDVPSGRMGITQGLTRNRTKTL